MKLLHKFITPMILAMPLSVMAVQSLPEPLATILRIALFVDWPEHTSSVNDEFKLCQTGTPPQLQPPLPLVHGKPLNIVKLNPNDDNSDCHILFLDEGTNKELNYHLARTVNMPVLVLAQKPIGADIQLKQNGRHYRFSIDQAALQRRHLHAHPQLLMLTQPHTPALN